ncbi:hypothetical protein AVEN_85903-1, partial [Araneus ventricosus]
LMLHRGVYQDPFLAYAGAERYQLPASYAASAAYTAAAARSYAAAAAAAQPVASYTAVAGISRRTAPEFGRLNVNKEGNYFSPVKCTQAPETATEWGGFRRNRTHRVNSRTRW